MPVVTNADTAKAGNVIEAGNTDAGGVVDGTATASGTLTSSDVDAAATKTWSITDTEPSTTYGALVLNASTGVWTYTLDNTKTATQALKEGETVTQTYTARVTDDKGAYAEQTITVTINGTNDVPVVTNADTAKAGSVTEAGNTDPGVVVPGTPTATGSLTSSDVDASATQAWSLQGTPSTTYGTMALDAGTGVWTYTLDNSLAATQALKENESVTQTYTARVTDDKGAYVDQTVTVTITGTDKAPIVVKDVESGDDRNHQSTRDGSPPPVNHDPVAVADKGATTENSPVTINVLANDRDPDTNNTLSVTDASVAEKNGTVRINSDGTLTFTPAHDFHGNATINYTVSDGQGGTDSSTVAVTVAAVNQAPALTDSPAHLSAVDEDHSKTISSSDLLKGYTDADHDTLSVRGLSADHGTVTTNENGSFTITPTGNYNGPIHLTYTVSDGQGGNTQATQSFTVTAVNDAPTLTSAVATLAPGAEDAAKSISAADLLKGYADVDGDKMSVADLSATHGKVTGSGDTFTFTPDANYNGEVRLNYTVSDGNGGSTPASLSFNVTPVNDAPVLTGSQAHLGDVAKGATTTITAHDLLNGFADPEGDTISVSNLHASQGTVSDGSNGNFTFASNTTGPVVLSYDVIDGHGGTIAATETFSVTGSSNSISQSSDHNNVTVHVDQTFGDVINLNVLLDRGGVLSFDSIKTEGNNTKVSISIDPDGPKGEHHAVQLATVTISGLQHTTSQDIMNALLDQHDLKL